MIFGKNGKKLDFKPIFETYIEFQKCGSKKSFWEGGEELRKLGKTPQKEKFLGKQILGIWDFWKKHFLTLFVFGKLKSSKRPPKNDNHTNILLLNYEGI